MSKDKELKSPERRRFFRKAGVGIGAAGAVALGLQDAPAKAAESSGANVRDGGYRETDHVKKAYETARF